MFPNFASFSGYQKGDVENSKCEPVLKRRSLMGKKIQFPKDHAGVKGGSGGQGEEHNRHRFVVCLWLQAINDALVPPQSSAGRSLTKKKKSRPQPKCRKKETRKFLTGDS